MADSQSLANERLDSASLDNAPLDNGQLEANLQKPRKHNLSQQIDLLALKSNLTVSQLLLWLGQQLNPGIPLYNMVFSFTLRGGLDPIHFQKAFQALIDRCDILRLTFSESNGIPQQQIRPTAPYSLPCLDFSSDTNPQGTARQWMTSRSVLALNCQERLFDSALLKVASDHFIWYVNFHHLITDNWSVSLIYRILQDLYGRSLQGHLASAPEIPSYLHYAQREQGQSPWRQTAIAYWRQKRQNTPPPVSLYGQSLGQNCEFMAAHTERIYCELGLERSQALRALAATPEARSLSQHQSLFNVFLTLLFAYLYRISGSPELAIASPAHNRPTPVLKETPGLFMELFPLQVAIEPNETFTSLLGKTTRESMAFLRYAQPGLSHQAIDRNVNVVLSYINVTFPDFYDMPAQTEWIHAGYGDGQHHLRLEVQDFDAKGNFTLQFDFNCDLIPAAQRQWASEHFSQLTDAWLEDAQQPIAAVDILAKAERSLLLGMPQAFRNASNTTLVDRFQQQVMRVPAQTAVVIENQTLTYAELEAQANQLAHYLIKQGARGTPVGLFMERSIPMLVGILGILKAGAAYMPINPDYPRERTQFMVADGQVTVLVTQPSLVQKLPDFQVKVIGSKADWAAISQEPSAPPDVVLNPQDLAYILFTSGSTGQPKGVMVEHRNVLTMLQGFEHIAPAGAELRGTAVCSYGFDVSVWELFSNLCFGGAVHLIPADVVSSPDRFAQCLIAHTITSAYIPPALLPQVIAALEREPSAEIALDRILVGVEPIQQGLLQRYRQRLPQLCIVNGYGPTETTICATFYVFDEAIDPQANTPIGKALPGYEAAVVNPQGQRVPIGVKGEIVIGGAGLSRGYLNQPELMAERFIDNPVGSGKCYKTGDQAHYLPDGNLEFLGRLDHQVKIRGFRVELSEVETALNQHPSIQQAAVIAQETAQGSQALLAYLAMPDATLTSSQIRAALQQKLPDYMIPSTFVALDALPLTPSGKIDRRRLASADYVHRERLGSEADYAAPESDLETYLAKLWSQCLQVEPVGIHDDFFDLGGDSITAIQIAAQATEAGLALSPQNILQHSTIARLLAQTNPQRAIAPALEEPTGQVPLTPIQHAFFEQDLADPHHWNQSLLLEIDQPLNPTMLETALQRLLQRHSALSFRFTRGDSGWRQQSSDTVPTARVRYCDLSQQSRAGQDRLMAIAEAELQISLDLVAGELLRAALFDLGTNRPQRLLLIIHHLAVDGVSWLTLLADLETFYRQLQGEPVSHGLPTTPFQTWSVGIVTAARAGAFQAELAYWLRPAWADLQALPRDSVADRPGDNTVASTQTVITRLDLEDTRSLLKAMPKHSRAQVNEVLLTALALTFCRTFSCDGKQPCLLVDIEGHGREEEIVTGTSLTRTVGWFTTVFPLMLTLPPSVPQLDRGELLQSVKAQLRQVPSHGIGYGILRYLAEDAEVTAQLQALPQSEILLNYLGDQSGLLPANSRFRLARELGLSRSPRGQRRYLLEVTAEIVQGQLQVKWVYSQSVHQRSMIKGWADALMVELRSLIAYYVSPESSPKNTVTPVDFPLANLTPQKLDKIAALLNAADASGPSG